MTSEIQNVVKKAPLALVVGADDANFGGASDAAAADTTTSG